MGKQDPIISFLRQEKIIDEDKLQTVIDQQRETGLTFISILKKENLLDEHQLTRVIAATSNIEFVNLSPEMVDPLVAHLISYDMANRYCVIPIKKENDQLLVAMSSPTNLSVRDQIETKTGYKVVPAAATISAIRQAIHYHFDVANVTKQAIASMRLKESTSQNIQYYDDDPHSSAKLCRAKQRNPWSILLDI